jgi:hypothetical protein
MDGNHERKLTTSFLQIKMSSDQLSANAASDAPEPAPRVHDAAVQVSDAASEDPDMATLEGPNIAALEDLDMVAREVPAWKVQGFRSEKAHRLSLVETALRNELEDVKRYVRERKRHVEDAHCQLQGHERHLQQERRNAEEVLRDLKVVQRQIVEEHLRGRYIPAPPARVWKGMSKDAEIKQYELEYGPSTPDLVARVSDLVRNSNKDMEILANSALNNMNEEGAHALAVLAEFRRSVAEMLDYPVDWLTAQTMYWLGRGHPHVSTLVTLTYSQRFR